MNDNDSGSPREQVLFLARAESRVRIMDALTETEPMTQRQLRAQVDASRTTVSRALQSLMEKGWVEGTGNAYRLTRTGAHIAAAFERLLGTVGRVDELGEFLRRFPSDVDSPALPDASDVTVTYSTDASPYAPARKQSEVLNTAERLRVLLPAVDVESTELLVEQVIERGLNVETVVSPGVESVIESEEFAPRVKRMVRAGGLRVLVSRGDLPFYLGLADESTVQIGLAGDDGLPRALLETTEGEVREWAERLYGDVRDRAEPKPLGEF
jgi:predicted transcriptional regulator